MNEVSNTDATGHADPAILIVEDSMEEALLVKIALAKALPDIPITLAQDGDKGLQLIQENEYVLAVIDLNLPGLDGIELLKAAGTFKPGMPTIAVTGYTSLDYLDGAYRAGASAVMTKPLDLREFTKVATNLAQIDKTVEASAGPSVLAIGVRAGDIESGCGGILLKHREHGHNVVIAIAGEPEAYATAVELVASMYDARVIFHPMPNTPVSSTDTERWIERLVSEESPLIMYLPSENDTDEDRATAQKAALAGGAAVPKVLAYQCPGSTTDFKPKVFVDVGPFMNEKIALVRGFGGFNLENLDPSLVRATARYWGRFSEPEEVEPLEILRG